MEWLLGGQLVGDSSCHQIFTEGAANVLSDDPWRIILHEPMWNTPLKPNVLDKLILSTFESFTNEGTSKKTES